MKVDIEACNFVSKPVIAVSVEGGSACTSSRILQSHRPGALFYLYTIEDRKASQMIEDTCVVHWSAFGYNC